MKLLTAALLVVGLIAGLLAGWYTLLHFDVGVAGGNTCTVQELGLQLVHNKLKPRFQLVTDGEASDGNTIHDPADLGLMQYKPIPADQQAELDNCAAITSAPDFDADMMARLKRLHLDLVVYGPRLQNGKAVIWSKSCRRSRRSSRRSSIARCRASGKVTRCCSNMECACIYLPDTRDLD